MKNLYSVQSDHAGRGRRPITSSSAPEVSSANHATASAAKFAMVAIAIVSAIACSRDWMPEFGRHPDEAAHLITGTLAHDWVMEDMPWPPLEYARDYYLRYPKVALGHWPPGFYAIQCAWYAMLGVSRWSATLLIAVFASAYLLMLLALVRTRTSLMAASGAIALAMISPVMRYVGSSFMAELVVASLSLGALWCFTSYLMTGRLLPALGFGFLAAAAILTKQDAITLGAVPPIGVLLLRRWDLLRDRKFYLPALIVLALCAPYHLATYRFAGSAWEGLPHPPIVQKLRFLATGLVPVGWGCLPLLAIGGVAIAREWRRSPSVSSLAAVFAGHAAGVVAIQLATPVSMDPRYLVPLLGPFALLAAMGFHLVLSSSTRPVWLRYALAASLGAIALIGMPPGYTSRVAGYRDLVGSIGAGDGPQIVLVCSDSRGDGAIAAEFRLQHPSDRFYLIRADKVLASSTWMGQNYEANYDRPDQVAEFIEAKAIDYIIFDPFKDGDAAHHELVAKLLADNPERYPVIGASRIVRRRGKREQRGTARIHEVVPDRDHRGRRVEISIPNLPGGEAFVIEK